MIFFALVGGFDNMNLFDLLSPTSIWKKANKYYLMGLLNILVVNFH